MGHAAVTSATTHRFAETFARGGIGQAGVEAVPFQRLDRRLAMREPATARADSRAAASSRPAATDFAYELALAADRPLVLQGDAGYSVKSERGQASYYYSQPFFARRGTLTLDGRAIPVTGQAWIDREWSSQPLAADQKGWDWFSLHLTAAKS